jgi:hypothetical protein
MHAWDLCRYIPGGIADDAFSLQFLNIFIPNILALINFPNCVFSHVFSHHTRTQAMTDHLMHPPPFSLPSRVANIVKTVALACIYMPVLPVSAVLGMLACIASYLVDHILVFRVCKKPPAFGLAALSGAINCLWLLPLGWLFLMEFVYFPAAKFKEGQSPPVRFCAVFASGLVHRALHPLAMPPISRVAEFFFPLSPRVLPLGVHVLTLKPLRARRCPRFVFFVVRSVNAISMHRRSVPANGLHAEMALLRPMCTLPMSLEVNRGGRFAARNILGAPLACRSLCHLCAAF